MDARSARRIWIRIGIPIAQHPLMRKCEAFLSVLMLAGGVVARSQTTSAEAGIDKNSISVHRVRSGNMPLRLMPAGEIVSISPPEWSSQSLQAQCRRRRWDSALRCR